MLFMFVFLFVIFLFLYEINTQPKTGASYSAKANVFLNVRVEINQLRKVKEEKIKLASAKSYLNSKLRFTLKYILLFWALFLVYSPREESALIIHCILYKFYKNATHMHNKEHLCSVRTKKTVTHYCCSLTTYSPPIAAAGVFWAR